MSSRLALVLVCTTALVGAGCSAAPEFVPNGSEVVASGESASQFLMGSGEVIVESGGEVTEGIVIGSGSVVVEEGAQVGGDVVVGSGTIEIYGEVAGDVYAFSGEVVAGPNAEIGGDVGAMSGDLAIDDSTTVGGTVTRGGVPTHPIGIRLESPSPLEALIQVALRALLPALVAAILAAVAPSALGRIAGTGGSKTAVSWAMGCLSSVLAAVIVVVLIIGICTIPLAMLLMLALVLTVLLGWAGLGLAVGRRLSPGMGVIPAAALGTFLLSLAVALIGLIPCCGWLFEPVVDSLALGAALLTRWGTRPYPAGAGTSLQAPPA